MSKIKRSKRFETERIHTPRNRLRAVLGCWHSRQFRDRLHRLTTAPACRPITAASGGRRPPTSSRYEAEMPTLVIGAVFRHRNLPGKPSLRQHLALHGGQACVGVFVIACLI